MHNDDSFFQYFSLDFKESDSAHHGSSILTQAVFVNDAVEKINILYRSMNPKGKLPHVPIEQHSIDNKIPILYLIGLPFFLNIAHILRSCVSLTCYVEPVPKVMLVGHSIGGMVARTSVVLDNHPKCAVSDIILLSSPSLR
jgi:triacylglycerol esterase/lipase EstA (alpha/beta hydrolase family)